MTQHTAENIFPQIEGCTCTILGLRSLRDTIRLCPLHRAAPDLLAALKAAADAFNDISRGVDVQHPADTSAHANEAEAAVRAALAKAEEGS